MVECVKAYANVHAQKKKQWIEYAGYLKWMNEIKLDASIGLLFEYDKYDNEQLAPPN